ncbi:hypothetical protein [uncultured Croceitalea sp.]|uniref:hypothetical protein n=1 Tax=uncultured Croceitalea sp. TaxID=1798908 RepID=UPI00374EC305
MSVSTNSLKAGVKTFVFLLFLLLGTFVNGQKDSSSVDIGKKFDDFMKQNESSISDSLKYYQDLSEISRLKNEISKELYFEKQYSNYFTDNLNHRRRTFNWQLLSGKLIFVAVIIIVLCGLVFSGIQFYQSIKQVNSILKIVDSENLQKLDTVTKADKTEIELSLTNGIKINSSIIGLIILSLSIAFFYLYIAHVYPINQLSIDNTGFAKTEIIDVTENKSPK